MKKTITYLLSILFLSICYSSCTYTKRQHNKGFHVEFVKKNNRKVKSKPSIAKAIKDSTSNNIVYEAKGENLEASITTKNNHQHHKTQDNIKQQVKKTYYSNIDLKKEVDNKEHTVQNQKKNKTFVLSQAILKLAAELALYSLLFFIVGYLLLYTSKAVSVEALLGFIFLYF